MLHVLNGDATAVVFAAAGLPGETLVWRDIVVEGPVAECTGTRPTAPLILDLASPAGQRINPLPEGASRSTSA